MLYSYEDNWKKERGWIIKFIADGLSSTADWKAFKRRHTWDLLGTLYESSPEDRPLRRGVLQVCTSYASLFED
jgi:nucleolar pre-ribosomal-associated protein 1